MRFSEGGEGGAGGGRRAGEVGEDRAWLAMTTGMQRAAIAE